MALESREIKERVRGEYREPRRYRVVLYNDDFTTFDFVMMVLMRVFRKEMGEAERITMTVHRQGKSPVGEYSYDVAMSRCRRTVMMAREANFPLRVECEPVGD